MAKLPKQTPDEYFAVLEEPHKTVALRTRMFLLTTAPELHEEMKYGTPFYTFRGMVCYLSASPKNGVYLGFPNGIIMSDTFQLFSGHDLKQIRHIAITDADFLTANAESLQNYITEAMVINDSKDKY
jgi:hypothetical protein